MGDRTRAQWVAKCGAEAAMPFSVSGSWVPI